MLKNKKIYIILSICIIISLFFYNYKNAKNISITNKNLYFKKNYPLKYLKINKNLKIKPGTNIALISIKGANNYSKKIKQGAMLAVKDLNKFFNYKGKNKIKLIFKETNEILSDQINILDEIIAKNYNAIGINILDPASYDIQFEIIKKNGITLALFNSSKKDTNSIIRYNNIKDCKNLARTLCKQINYKGNIILFKSNSMQQDIQEKEYIFKKEIEKYKDIHIVHIYNNNTFSYIKNKNKIKSLDNIYKFKNISAYCALDNNSFNILTNDKKINSKHSKIFGFTYNSNPKNIFKNKNVKAVILENPYMIGYATIMAIANNLSNINNVIITIYNQLLCQK